MVKDEFGDWVDAETVEHPKADLRVALEHEPLRVAQRAGLAKDLLRNGELAKIVQSPCETCELDLLHVEPEPLRDLRGELADPVGVSAGVRVARVDRFRERGGGAVTGGLVRPCCEP